MKSLRHFYVIALTLCLIAPSVAAFSAPATGRKHSRASVRPGDTLRISLLSPLGTRENHEGDRFTARVLEPDTLREAFVEGSINTIRHSGRVSGRAEMELTFDTLTLPNDQQQKIAAQVEAVHRKETEVDSEGHVRSKSRQDREVLIFAGGTGLGTAIGAAVGGRKGAAIGAVIGAVVGTSTIFSTRGPELDFPAGTEMSIRITQ